MSDEVNNQQQKTEGENKNQQQQQQQQQGENKNQQQQGESKNQQQQGESKNQQQQGESKNQQQKETGLITLDKLTPEAKTALETEFLGRSFRDTIKDENLRKEAERHSSPTSIVEALINTKKELSGRIKVPDEKAPAEEIAKFHKAIGVPDKPEGYEIKLADGVTMTDSDKGVLAAMLPIAHKNGVPASAFNGFVNEYVALARKAEVDANKQIVDFGKAAEAELRREMGTDFDANLKIANKTAGAVGPEFKAFLNETVLPGGGMLGDHPFMVKLLAKFGRGMEEGQLMIGASPAERTTIQQQIDELNKTVPVGSAGYTKPEHQAKLTELYGKLHGNAGVVGAGGRAA